MLQVKTLKCLPAVLVVFLFISCKKENHATGSETDIKQYVIEDSPFTELNKYERTVTVAVDDQADRKALRPVFQLSPGATATVNGVPQKSSDPVDLSNPITYYVVQGADGSKSTWQVNVRSSARDIGLGISITAEKHNDPNPFYPWYFSQDTSHVPDAFGGDACLSMAMYWSDLTVRYDVNTIFSEIAPTKIGMFPELAIADVTGYLTKKTIPWKLVSLPDRIQTIKNILDKGYIMILCVDLRYVPYDYDMNHHVERFYPISRPGGHYIIVKGYRITDGASFWLEVYDPLSKGYSYTNTRSPKGKDRYYHSEYIQDATDKWWDNAIVVGKHYRVMDKLDTEVKFADVYNTSGY